MIRSKYRGITPNLKTELIKFEVAGLILYESGRYIQLGSRSSQFSCIDWLSAVVSSFTNFQGLITMSTAFVAILMGSESDLPIMKSAVDILKQLQINYEVKITSAHRTPSITQAYISDAQERGCQVFISGAGLAAHLAGATAAHTTVPVIGVPIDSGPLSGLDALLSTVQMPAGIPVATVAIGKTGAKNAAYLAAQILSLADAGLAGRVKAERAANSEKVQAQDRALQESLS